MISSINKSKSKETNNKKEITSKSKHKLNKHNKKQQQKQCKQQMIIKPIRLIKKLKQMFSLLPQNTIEYRIQQEGRYLSKLSEIHQLLRYKSPQNERVITSQVIFNLINYEKQLKQLVQVFNSLTSHKQIVMSILIEIYKRVMDYIVELVVKLRNNKNKFQSKQQKDNNKQKHEKDDQIQRALQLMGYIDKEIFESIQFLLTLQFNIQQYTNTNNNKQQQPTFRVNFNNNTNYQQQHKQQTQVIVKQQQSSSLRINIIKQLFYRRSSQLLNKYKWLNKRVIQSITILNNKHINLKHFNQTHYHSNQYQQQNGMIVLLYAIEQFTQLIIKHIQVINKFSINTSYKNQYIQEE